MNKRVLIMLAVLFAACSATFARDIRINDTPDAGTQFQIDCSEAASEGTTSVFFYDDGLNGSYTANRSYTVQVTSGNAGAISVKFTTFNLATGTTLTIRDAVSLTVFASNATGTSLANQTFTSNRGSLEFIWTSGASTAQGFKAKVWCGDMCQIFNTTINPSVSPTTELNPNTGLNENYYDVCSGDAVSFTANSTFPQNNYQYTQSESTLDYTWGVVYMGDTIELNHAGVGASNFSFAFPHGGGFYVFCDAADNRGCLNRNINTRKIRVSMPPTWEAVNFDPDSVCPGTLVTFNGAPHVEPWSYEPPAIIAGATFLPDGDGVCYNTALVFEDVFPEGATLTSVNDIERVYLNMEHSYLGDLSMLLQCPNGQSCLLHAQSSSELTLVPGWTLSSAGVNNSNSMGGGMIHLGLAPDPGSSNNCYYTAGEGYEYNFTPTATQPMGGSSYNNPNTTSIRYTDPCGNAETSDVLNAGDYATYERLSSLVGCPLNGEWRIYVCDHMNLDNGWIFEWGLFFNPNLYLSNVWEFQNTYSTSTYMWNGENMNPTAGATATAIVQNPDPNNMGQIPYTFSATDNFNCTYDTTVAVHVLASLDPGCCLQPSPTVAAGNTLPCSNSTTLSVTSGYSMPGNTGEWTYSTNTGGVAVFSSPTSLNTSVSVNIYGDYTFTWHEYYQGNHSCTNEASVNVNFSRYMDATLADVPSYCRSNAMVTLSAPDFGTLSCTYTSGTGQTQNYTGPAFNAEAHTFTPSAATPGQYTIRNQINGERCADPSSSTVTFSIYDELSVDLEDPICSQDHTQVTLNFNIHGVTSNVPPTYRIYNVYTENENGMYGSPNQVNDSLLNQYSTTYSVTVGNPIEYAFRFADNNRCSNVTIPGYFDCGCPYDAGSFADYSPRVRCTGESIALGHSGQSDEGVLSFIICQTASDVYNSHICTLPGTTTSIAPSDIPGFAYNRQYYIVAVCGQASGLGAWGSGCRSVTRAVPIMWKEKPVATATQADTCGRVITLRGNEPGDGMQGYWTATAGYTTIAGTDNTMYNATVLSDVDGIVNYTWHIVNAECTGESSATPYNFRKIPTPQAGTDRTICGLSGEIIGASRTQPPIDGSSISWSAVGVTLNPPTSEQPVANANSEGTYTITLTERNGTCVGSDDVLMTFINVPSPFTSSNVDTVCGQVAELQALGSENPGSWTAYRMDGTQLDVVSYQAYGDPTDISANNAHCFATVIIPNDVSEVEYEFRWKEPIIDPRLPADAECYGEASKHVVFRKMPSVSVHACNSTGDEIAVCGRTVELCADTIASAGYATYSWVNKDVSGRFTDSLSSHTFFTIDSAFNISTYMDVPFYFIARNRSCMIIDTMNVRFLEMPDVKAGPDYVVCGRNYDLNGAWGLPPTSTYTPACSWYVIDRPQGAQAPQWDSQHPNDSIVEHVQVNGYGVYTFVVRETNTAGNASSCYSTDTVRIEFMQKPVVDAGQNQKICGLDFTMQALGSHVEGDSIVGSWVCLSGGNAAFDDRTDPRTHGHFSSYGPANFLWIETNHPQLQTDNPETCASSDTVQLTFFEIPSAAVNMNAADTVTCGFTFEFLRADASGSNIQGMWIGEPGAYASFGALTSTVTDVTVDRYGKHNFYWVEYNGPTDDQHFCKDTSEAWTVEFVQPPVAQIVDTIMRFCDSTGQLHVNFNGVGEGRWSASVPPSIVWFSDRDSCNTVIHTNILNSENAAYPYFTLYWHVQNTDFCTDEDSIRVTFAAPPSDSLVVIPPMCFGGQAVITALEDNLPTYDWDFDMDGGILDSLQYNQQNGAFRAFVHWDDRDSLHTVGIATTNKWMCMNVGTATVQEPPLPVYHYNIIQDTCSLGKGGIEFLDTVGQFTFFWTDTTENSANITGPDPATGIISSHHVYGLPAGTYSYRAEYMTRNTTYLSSYISYFHTTQCIDRPEFEIGTIGMIEADIAVSAEVEIEALVAPDARVTFVNTTNYDNMSNKKCEWHFGDGVTEKNCDELVEHIYAEPGCYEPFLIVMNRDLPECRDTAFLDLETVCGGSFIYVDKASKLEVPNIFSPNDDGINDYFQVEAQTLKKFNGKIINRYGRLVYEWTDWETPEAGWDGRLNGTTKATPGVYYYIIEAEGFDGKEYPLQGVLHLVR